MAATDSTLLSQPWCQVCHSKKDLEACAECSVVHYCGPDHQLSALPRHVELCSSIVKARREAEWVRREQIKDLAAGHPWIPDPSAYPTNADLLMQNRFDYVYKLLRASTRSALGLAVDEIEDMERLYSNDHFDPELPGLYLRLGRDQDCYDYIKYCHQIPRLPRASNDRMVSERSPYFSFMQSDAFEDPLQLYETITENPYRLGHVIAMALFKIRLLFRVQASHNVVLLSHRLPAELLYQIRCHLVTPIVIRDKKLLHDISNGASLNSHITKVEAHMMAALRLVHRTNRFFWPLLLASLPPKDVHIDGYDPGTEEEAQWLLLFSYQSWIENPRALDVVAGALPTL